MAPSFEKLFRAPYAVPNGLQAAPEGLWIADQISDRVALVELEPHVPYGVTKVIREIPSESSNTSGLTVGDGSLWVAANGAASLWRPPRPADAPSKQGQILRVDPTTGRTLQRWPLPGGGSTHGLDYDRFEPGVLWLTTLKQQTLTKVRIADWSVQRVLPLPYGRAHGVVRAEDGVWVVHTSDRLIVRLDPDSGAQLACIEVHVDQPEPHCLSAYDGGLLYCDATSGWIVRISL